MICEGGRVEVFWDDGTGWLFALSFGWNGVWKPKPFLPFLPFLVSHFEFKAIFAFLGTGPGAHFLILFLSNFLSCASPKEDSSSSSSSEESGA